jgi:hypothetical protein
MLKTMARRIWTIVVFGALGLVILVVLSYIKVRGMRKPQ